MTNKGLLVAVAAGFAIIYWPRSTDESDENRKPGNGKKEPPPVIAMGESISPLALTPAPAKLPGVRSWTLETRGPRRDSFAL